MDIQLRPHHFLCILGFRGKGYSPAFVEQFWKIVRSLTNDRQIEIEVVDQTDTICQPCPHRRESLCEKEASIRTLDRAHQHALEWEEKERITWEGALARIQDKLTLSSFHQICQNCSWKELGYCEAALKKMGIQ